MKSSSSRVLDIQYDISNLAFYKETQYMYINLNLISCFRQDFNLLAVSGPKSHFLYNSI